MTWATLLPIIIRDGIPAAAKVWQLVQSGDPITAAQWQDLQTLAAKSYDDYIREAMQRSGAPILPPAP